jgi:predicted HicB family RNase H-like nuclease
MKEELKAKTTAGKTKDFKQLTVRVPPDVHRALRIRAAEEGRSCAIIIEGLVRQYLVGGKRAS